MSRISVCVCVCQVCVRVCPTTNESLPAVNRAEGSPTGVQVATVAKAGVFGVGVSGDVLVDDGVPGVRG